MAWRQRTGTVTPAQVDAKFVNTCTLPPPMYITGKEKKLSRDCACVAGVGVNTTSTPVTQYLHFWVAGEQRML